MEYVEIAVAGANVKVPSAHINGKLVIVTGRWLRVAAVKDEDWQEGEVALAPDDILANVPQLKNLGADIFTFSQKPSDPTPRFPFFHELDNVAAIRITSYSDWWANRVGTDLRCDVRKAAKRGVIVREVPFTDDLVRAIMEIYDETPIRQGGPFWHYKKDFDTVKLANVTYLDQSDFLGAFLGDELIGFVKIVHVGRLARLMQIISKDAHRDKRPMNALIAKAVEWCEAKGCTHLTYGKYQYLQGADSLTAFKHRNGFEEILVPKYYVPLTTKGKLALRLHLHSGVKALVPDPVLQSLKRVRGFTYRNILSTTKRT
ncbi:MAG: GNAT family N-acetyltransferase [Terriglobales bacterium]